MATTQNSDPTTIFHKEITFSTTDEISGQIIAEGYNVSGPFNSTITSVTLTGGKKCVVPITSDTGQGAPYLKFHFPNGTSSNRIYLTFAVKNSNMADGFYDYKTGIPTTYKSKLKQFIISHLPVSQQFNATGTKTKALRFTTYGSSTNKPAEAVTFYFTFSALFSTQLEVAQSVENQLATSFATPTTPVTSVPGRQTIATQITGFPGRVIGG
jgi:hypothetical protein